MPAAQGGERGFASSLLTALPGRDFTAGRVQAGATFAEAADRAPCRQLCQRTPFSVTHLPSARIPSTSAQPSVILEGTKPVYRYT